MKDVGGGGLSDDDTWVDELVEACRAMGLLRRPGVVASSAATVGASSGSSCMAGGWRNFVAGHSVIEQGQPVELVYNALCVLASLVKLDTEFAALASSVAKSVECRAWTSSPSAQVEGSLG